MKKSLLFVILLAGIYTIKSQTPIVLGNSNMPGSNDTLRYTNVAINSVGNYTQTGANYSWNFSNVVSTSEGVRSFKNALQTPYALFFLALNEYGEKIADTLGAGPILITKYWNYYKKQTSPFNAFIADGVGMTLTLVPLPSYYSDKDELYKFPMTYPQYDSTTFKFSSPSTTIIPVVYTKAGYRVTKVDGWGKVITPYDTADCLRLITTQYAMDTIKTTLGPITIPLGFPNYQRSYQWMTLNSKIPFLEINGTLLGDVFTMTQARYRGYNLTPLNPVGVKSELDISAMSLYPNPVKDRLWLSSDMKTEFDYTVSDINGKILSQDKITDLSSFQSIDVSEFAQGLYVIHVKQNQSNTYLKFIKE